MIKINIGSGFVGKSDWINLDKSILARLSKIPFLIPLLAKIKLLPQDYQNVNWPPIRICDCRKRLPFRNNEVDVIYTSHFLEHVYRHEAVKIFRECYRVLRPGGIIRIALPDTKKLTRAYLEGNVSILQARVSQDPNIEFSVCDSLAIHFYPPELNYSEPPSLGRKFQELFLARHKWAYDFDSLKILLWKTKFREIEEKEFGESVIEDAKLLDVMPEVSFYTEAKKL